MAATIKNFTLMNYIKHTFNIQNCQGQIIFGRIKASILRRPIKPLRSRLSLRFRCGIPQRKSFKESFSLPIH